MLYSDYCKYAPQVRYTEFNQVKKQMFKIHAPHRESGYIAKIDYQQTKDIEGISDWEMFYTPGLKAQAEFKSFTYRQAKQQGTNTVPSVPPVVMMDGPTEQPMQRRLALSEIDNNLVSALLSRGITEKKALELLGSIRKGQELMDQLEYVDEIIGAAPRGKFHNPSGFYVRFLEDNSVVPDSFCGSRKRRLYEEAQQKKNAAIAAQAKLEMDYDEYRCSETEQFIQDMLPPNEYQSMFDRIRRQNQRVFRQMTPAQLDDITKAAIVHDLRESGRIPMLSLKDFAKDRLAAL